MKPVDTVIREFHDRVTEIERVLDVIESVMGSYPESDLNNAVWAIVGGYAAAIGQSFHCEAWLDWWWLECGLGAQPKCASPHGENLRMVATIDDLVALILEDQQ